MPFKKATKVKLKAKLLFFGTSGSGKTYSALELATYLGSGKIAVIETSPEAGNSSLFSTEFPHDISDPIEVMSLENLVNNFKEAEQLVGENGVVIIDSMTDFWSGTGGVLEEVEKMAIAAAAKNNTKNPDNRNAWGTMTPKMQKALNIVFGSQKTHLIVVCRSKDEKIQQTYTDRNGREKTREVTVSAKPEFRADFEYRPQASLFFDKVMDADGNFHQLIRNNKPPRIDYFKNFRACINEDYEYEGELYTKWDAKKIARNFLHALEQGEDPQLLQLKEQLQNNEKLSDLVDKYQDPKILELFTNSKKLDRKTIEEALEEGVDLEVIKFSDMFYIALDMYKTKAKEEHQHFNKNPLLLTVNEIRDLGKQIKQDMENLTK